MAWWASLAPKFMMVGGSAVIGIAGLGRLMQSFANQVNNTSDEAPSRNWKLGFVTDARKKASSSVSYYLRSVKH